MARLFDEHKKREVKLLSGTWQMLKDQQNVGRSEKWQNGLCGAHTVTVPSVWNCEIDMLTYEGAVWYEKKFYTAGGTLRFNFGSVMTDAEVYLDGELLGRHYGGFLRFDFIKENVSAGEHLLTVRADNSFDRAAIPQPTVDWYHYGGITRAVELETLCGITVLSNKMDYTLHGDKADAIFTLELYNASDAETSDTLTITLGEERVANAQVTLSARERKTLVIDGVCIKDIARWSPESPNLYSLVTETASDDLIDRTGFREVEIKNRAIYLNGKKLRLRGINRHEDHPDFGMAFPEALMHRDIDIIKRAGCNSVRGSHYPNNPTFVDLLDEHGLTFWSEIPIWGGGFPPELLADPEMIERGLTMHREMLKEYYNHPSVIIWGMHNEIDTRTEQALNITKIYYRYLKENGGNRLVTYASNRMNNDICFEYTDLICFNSYVDWYPFGGFPSWEVYADAMEEHLRKMGVDDKPVITSEFGAAAIYGHHTFDDLKWTEEYQARSITDCIKLFFSREEYAGTYIWQFADIRTSEQMGLNRARSFNNKGLLNEYRRPKMAYHAVSQIYNEIKKEEESK